MRDHQSAARQELIPPRLLPVLQEIELLRVAQGCQPVGLVARVDIVQLHTIGHLRQLLGGHPAHAHPLEGVVRGRRPRVVVVGTIVHQVVGTQVVLAAVRRTVVVGKAQHMAKLVAELRDAGRLLACVAEKFRRTGEDIDLPVVQREVVARLREVPFLGPHRVGTTSRVLSITGKDDVDHIHESIVVVVVLREVDVKLAVGQLASLHNHGLGILVLVVDAVVAAIVGHFAREGNGAYHVEGGLELSHRLVDEVVAGRPREAHVALHVVVGKSFFVHHPLMILLAEGNLLVGEIGQDDQPVGIALRGKRANLVVGSLRLAPAVGLARGE